jgi:hypothetical protein
LSASAPVLVQVKSWETDLASALLTVKVVATELAKETDSDFRCLDENLLR